MVINDTINRQHTGQICRDVIEQAGIDFDALEKRELHYGQLDRIAERMERDAKRCRQMAADGPQCEQDYTG